MITVNNDVLDIVAGCADTETAASRQVVDYLKKVAIPTEHRNAVDLSAGESNNSTVERS